MLNHLKTHWDTKVRFRSGDLEGTHFIQRSIMAPLLQRRRRRAAIAQLQSLTDHLLADIGISRGDIPRVVEGLISRDARAAAPQTPISAAEEPRDQLRRAA